MQKPLSAVWNFLLKFVFFSGFYVYVELFYFNGKENNLFIAIEVKLPSHKSLIKMLILEENFKLHLFASELFIYMCVCVCVYMYMNMYIYK